MSHFRTKRLAFACYLHANRLLTYQGARNDSDNRVEFTFADEQGIGDQLELDFDGGAKVSAVALFSSQTYLRRQIVAAQNQNRNGEPRNGYRPAV